MVLQPPDEPLPTASLLADLGAYDAQRLAELTRAPQPFLVEGLIQQGTVNIMVGDSGIGKTPLLVQLGVSVASGRPFCGLAVERGGVLYVDCESDPSGFQTILLSVTKAVGLPKPPDDFLIYSPQWDVATEGEQPALLRILHIIERLRPRIVIIDPLRVIWPLAESKSEEAVAMIALQRKMSREFGCAWINIHHCRKPSQEAPQIALSENPHQWLLEAAGSRALINQTDSRLGVGHGSDLVVAGFVRMVGDITPFHLRREYDEAGDPQYYSMIVGFDALTPAQREFFTKLPPGPFTHAQACETYKATHGGGLSKSQVGRHLKAAIRSGLLARAGNSYKKTT